MNLEHFSSLSLSQDLLPRSHWNLAFVFKLLLWQVSNVCKSNSRIMTPLPPAIHLVNSDRHTYGLSWSVSLVSDFPVH